MSNNPQPDYTKQISDAVRTTIDSGDLSHLKDVGSAVQGAVESAFPSDNTPKNKNPAPQPAFTSPSGTKKQENLTKTEHFLQMKSSKAKVTPKTFISRSGFGMGSLVSGLLGLFCFGIGFVGFTAVALLASMPTIAYLPGAIPLLLFTASSIWLFSSGIAGRGLIKRLRQYAGFFDKKTVWSIEALSTATNISPARIRKDIRKALKQKLLYDIQMDTGETCIIQGTESYHLYLESERAREEREEQEAEHQRLLENPKTAPIELFRSEGQATLQKLRTANAAIADEAFSEKLQRLEITVGRIFSYVEAHPQKLPDTRKFMEYYLPTTLKLVEKYHQYELENLRMDAVLKAKADITSTLDTIDIAFNNLLESLYHEDTLDISTDIDALHAMLEQEGLTQQAFEIELNVK